ncbi:MAG: hypothetical protein ACLVAT_12685 [Lachnospiraceae bacterium]
MLLQAAGYQKRTCETYFWCDYARKAAIEECVEKAFSVLRDLPNVAKAKMHIVNWLEIKLQVLEIGWLIVVEE